MYNKSETPELYNACKTHLPTSRLVKDHRKYLFKNQINHIFYET